MAEKRKIDETYDLICVGGGIMSATLALLLKLVDKNKKILILEKLNDVALESSEAWNNAGTGHTGFCELNYTPEKSDGSIDITKAVNVCTEFEKSKELWTYLIKQGFLKEPGNFIHAVPHHSWVTGKDNVDFLRKRHAEMVKHVMFKGMKYSENFDELRQWFPLIMHDRKSDEIMAGTRIELGTEVNYGVLTKLLFNILRDQFGTTVHTEHEALDVDPSKKNKWLVEIKELSTGAKIYCNANHVFIGAGGGALPLLEKVEIPEKQGYGGFPVSGEWLICNNQDIIKQHHAKVYSKAGLGAPPMSVPHLDTRYIKGRQELLFGPFAGFSTKFLKQGSYLDWFKSIRWDSIPSLWGVFWHNIPLTEYLVKQVMMNHDDRVNALRQFIKDAKKEDWDLKVAGQRVQVIKRDEKEGGILEFGTEVVHSKDGRITALLGASPGASVAVHIALNVLKIAFPQEVKTETWQNRFSKMIPFWHKEIEGHEDEFKRSRLDCSKALQINLPIE